MDMHNPFLVAHYTALAFDYGLSKIGVAVGESLTKTAKPLTILRAQDGIPNYNEIEKIIKEWRPQVIIIGVPHNPNMLEEKISPNSQKIIKMALNFSDKIINNYQKTYNFQLYNIDEAYSSLEAKKIVADLRKNKLIKQGAKLDDIAACVILERWFAKN